MLIEAATVVTETESWSPGWLQTRGSRIVAAGAGPAPASASNEESFSFTGTVVPGFVDIHSHGAAGVDYSDAASGVSLEPALSWQRAHGTTTVVASLATAPLDELSRQVQALSAQVSAGAIRGIHLEGPWLSPAHRGAHSESLLLDPVAADVARLLALSGGIRMITLAPELPGGIEAIEVIVRAGVVAAIGHTSCDAATASRAFDAGATIATHLFNGMPQLHHREVGPVGAALLDDRVFLELILDGEHLAPAAVDLVFRLAGTRVIAVSDSMAAAGQPDNDYRLAGTNITVRDGVARTGDTNSLAGASEPLHSAFRRLVNDHGLPISVAVASTSARPARALGLADVGHLNPGAQADLIVLDSELAVLCVLYQGEWVR